MTGLLRLGGLRFHDVRPRCIPHSRHSETTPVIPNLFRNLIHASLYKNALLGGVVLILNSCKPHFIFRIANFEVVRSRARPKRP